MNVYLQMKHEIKHEISWGHTLCSEIKVNVSVSLFFFLIAFVILIWDCRTTDQVKMY